MRIENANAQFFFAPYALSSRLQRELTGCFSLEARRGTKDAKV
jgi:hypothetical protein